MIEFRFHGRGGQGAVTSAELLALAAIAAGKHGQAFPSFGPERRGAPVVANARIDDVRIRNRTAVTSPDVVIVLDPSILAIVDTSNGLDPEGFHVINTYHSAAELRERQAITGRVCTVNANKIAQEEIGRVITNTTMLGALIRATGAVERERLIDEIRSRFGRIAEGNINAFKRAYDECVIED